MEYETSNYLGNKWSTKDLPINGVKSEEIDEVCLEILDHLKNDPAKSIIITGEARVGKSSLINYVAEAFTLSENAHVYTVTAGNLKAGNRYIGDLERAIENFTDFLVEHDGLWICPRFHELFYAGKHDSNPSGILEQLLPLIISGKIRLIAEINNSDLEKLLTVKPELATAFEIVKVNESSKEYTLDLLEQWVANNDNFEQWSLIDKKALEEIYIISSQYLSYQSNPGAMIDLLMYTKQKYDRQVETKIRIQDIYESLSSLTGLPISILDDKEKLDLKEVEQFFHNKVIGQEEAVMTIVERIAMVKAGLTDPGKPFGIFLFVGPTGTGKTEITKCLAEYLFGSADRMIRLDMSEYQTADSYRKIFGEYSVNSEGSSLVNQIRQNPFSVILLDEFEKAHHQVWDLFLQVFDDGRLTDSQGGLVDFRQSIIILTSNLGAAMANSRIPVGFNPNKEEEISTSDPEANIKNAISFTFRPEFINRLDKIVVFKPLSPIALAKILDIELKKVLQRRGLRQRQWALDMEESAIEFLLEKGYTENLGARPLKRAIEQYLLAPLAMTIVNKNFPQGDQFLLVSKFKDGLKVTFIDPDEPEYTWEEKKNLVAIQKKKVRDLSLKKILLECFGTLAEFNIIQNELNKLNQSSQKTDMDEKKQDLMDLMSTSDFWKSEHQKEVLTHIEFFDRFSAVLASANQLYERLEDPTKERLYYDPTLLRKLAQNIYLLQASLQAFEDKESQDALIKISYKEGDKTQGDTIKKMYTNWAKKRGMELKILVNSFNDQDCVAIYSVFGFAAYHILKSEHGVHMFESKPSTERVIYKSKIKVSVLPMISQDYTNKLGISYLDKRFVNVESTQTVRKYNLDNSLIKDLKGKWQTGNKEKVLGGAFDLIES